MRSVVLLLLSLLTVGCGDGPVAPSVRQLEQGDTAAKRDAARHLAEQVPPAESAAAVPALVVSLGDADPDVRRLSAYALGRIGPMAQDALPPLRELLTDANEPVRLAAAYAINGIHPGDASVVPVLTRAAARGDVRAIIELGRMGPPAADATATLAAALRSPTPLARRMAAEALGHIGPAARPALPALKRSAADPDEDVRRAAAQAVALIDN